MERFVNRLTDKWKNLSDLQKYVVTGLMGASGVTALQYTAGFLQSILFGRVLGADGYGILANALHWLVFLGMPVGAVFRNLLVRRWPLASERERELLSGWTLKMGFVLSVIVATGFIIIIHIFPIFKDESVARGVKLAMIGFVFYALLQAISALFTAEKKPAVAILFTRAWLTIVLFIVGATYFFVTKVRNPYHYVYFSIGVNIIGVIVGILWLRWRRPNLIRISNVLESPLFMERLRTILRFAAITFLTNSSFTLPPILLGLLSNATELGVFHIALRFIGPVVVLNILMLNILMPVVSELYHNREYERLLKVVYKILMAVSGFSLLMGIVVAVVLYIILPELKDPAYGKSFPVFLMMVIAVILNIAAGNTNMFLNIAHKERYVLIAQGIAILVQTIVALLVIPIYGAIGAAFTFLVGPPLSKWIGYWMVRRKLGLKISLFDALWWYFSTKSRKSSRKMKDVG
ncbi:MAG: lipopolysaccharide biosynthesis protein [Chlorobi bacterium]|nr:lipopolysaccharide biosynthesis protein [Chlorobiota bacterium]